MNRPPPIIKVVSKPGTKWNQVWAYDFVMDRTHNGKRFRMLTIIDEYTRECLAIKVDRKLNSTDVVDTLLDLFVMHGVPDYIRSDNGSEFTARLVREWLKRLKVKTLFPVFIFIYYWYYEYNLMLQHMCCNICVVFHTFATYHQNLVLPGRTVTTNHSTASCEMNCLINGEIFYTFKEAQITTGLILEMYIDRAMEERVQHCSAAQLARLQTACTRNYCFELQRKNKKRRKENTDSIT